jgi:hypothetical protein
VDARVIASAALRISSDAPDNLAMTAATDTPNGSVARSMASCRRERTSRDATCSAESLSALIMFRLNTSTTRAISPISSWRSMAAMGTEVSPAASRPIATVNAHSGRVRKRSDSTTAIKVTVAAITVASML